MSTQKPKMQQIIEAIISNQPQEVLGSIDLKDRITEKQNGLYSNDGWNTKKLSKLIRVLEACADLEYELKNCIRGTYCKYAKDADSLRQYIIELGENLYAVAESI